MSTKERLGFFLTCSRWLVKLFLSNLYSSTSVLLSVDLFLRVCTTALDEEFFFSWAQIRSGFGFSYLA